MRNSRLLLSATLLLFASGVSAAQPTNRPARIYNDAFSHKISIEQCKAQLLELMVRSPNLPERIEAAERFAQLVDLHCQWRCTELGEGPTRKWEMWRDEQYRMATSVTLPLLETLDEAHRHSYPALILGHRLAMMIGQMRSADGLSTRAIALMENILDARPEEMVPPDKELAEDEDLEMEKEWCQAKLVGLKIEAAEMIFWPPFSQDFAVPGPPGLKQLDCAKVEREIRRIMAKYPNNEKVQEVANEKIQKLAAEKLSYLEGPRLVRKQF